MTGQTAARSPDMQRVVSVVVPVPALDRLDYEVPPALPVPAPGTRVLVPLGARVVTGCVVERSAPPNAGAVNAPPAAGALKPRVGAGRDARPPQPFNAPPAAGALKPLRDVLDAEPLLPAGVLDLALWVGEYYACGAGEAVAAAMPPRAWVVSERRVEITPAGRAALADRPGPARRRLLDSLADGRRTGWRRWSPGPAVAAGGITPSLRRWLGRGWSG